MRSYMRDMQLKTIRQTFLEHTGEKHTVDVWRNLVNKKLKSKFRIANNKSFGNIIRVLRKELVLEYRYVYLTVSDEVAGKVYLRRRYLTCKGGVE